MISDEVVIAMYVTAWALGIGGLMYGGAISGQLHRKTMRREIVEGGKLRGSVVRFFLTMQICAIVVGIPYLLQVLLVANQASWATRSLQLQLACTFAGPVLITLVILGPYVAMQWLLARDARQKPRPTQPSGSMNRHH